MFSAVAPILTLLASFAVSHVRAEPNPTTPGPGDVYIQGMPCTIAWDADTTGTWKSMSIQLMTGNNFDMIPLTTVASNIDGTSSSSTTYSYTCPVVSPHSAIYFYQFSSPSTSNKTWTTRFTITDSVNDVVAPTQSTQPDGQNIPWGTGQLVNGSGSAGSSGSPASSGSSVSPASTGAAASGGASTADSTPSAVAVASSTSSSTTPDVTYSTTYVVEPSPSSTVSANQTSGAATMPARTAVFFLHTSLAAIVFSVFF